MDPDRSTLHDLPGNAPPDPRAPVTERNAPSSPDPESPPANGKSDAQPAGDAKDKGKKKKKKGKFGSKRGIETLFRTQYPMHVDLSALADSKSNIMISINGLMISILIASISPKVDTNQFLIYPTITLLIGCVVSLIYAVLAAMPRVNRNPITLDDVRKNRANILFFGNFTHLTKGAYVEGMSEMLQDKDRLYQSMMTDIYALGGVLDRKFRLLRISYAAFTVGLFVGVSFFIGAYLFSSFTIENGTPILP